MADYTKITNFLAKDSLPLNNAGKYVKGSEIDAEFTSIAAADADNLKISSLGTGVETALGVNLGSAGALASLATAQTFTKPQRGTQTDNAASTSFDLNATNNFTCTTTGDSALTFTNIASATGQSGNILFINGGTDIITAAANTEISPSTLTAISATGTYLLGYYCNGTNVYVAATGALT